jgi:hypothetical protein
VWALESDREQDIGTLEAMDQAPVTCQDIAHLHSIKYRASISLVRKIDIPAIQVIAVAAALLQ